MRKVNRYVLFLRAFLMALVLGAPSTSRSQNTDAQDWETSLRLGTREAYFWYLRRNPTGQFTGQALEALRGMGMPGTESQSNSSSVRGLAGGVDRAQVGNRGSDSGRGPDPY